MIPEYALCCKCFANSSKLGLCYYAEQVGFDIPSISGNEFENLEIAARDGLYGMIGSRQINGCVRELIPYSARGLRLRDCNPENMLDTLNEIFEEGTDAEIMRAQNFQTTEELRNYLVTQLGAA